ncbi:MAG: DNA-directed RNA polymerase subunit alpha C-terminal domain-containing protein [bacterium]|nr:DNA-directed RNA polymerase subunit alpha C-terminal domain-containing protein [bacterium]
MKHQGRGGSHSSGSGGAAPISNGGGTPPAPVASDELLSRPIYEPGLRPQTANALWTAGITSLHDLVQKTEVELLRLPGFGPGSLRGVQVVLDRMGLRLGTKPALVMNPEIIERLYLPIEALVSARKAEILRAAHIRYVGDLVQKTGVELLRLVGLGQRGLNQVLIVLTDMGLHLGMKLENFDPSHPPTSIAVAGKKGSSSGGAAPISSGGSGTPPPVPAAPAGASALPFEIGSGVTSVLSNTAPLDAATAAQLGNAEAMTLFQSGILEGTLIDPAFRGLELPARTVERPMILELGR